MPRSVITEDQVRDEDFISQDELLDYSSIDIWTTVSGNYAASNRDNIFIDSSISNIVISLPLNPSYGFGISFVDAIGNCSDNNVTISGSGEKIMGLNENFIIDTNYANFSLTYFGGSMGWVLSTSGYFKFNII